MRIKRGNSAAVINKDIIAIGTVIGGNLNGSAGSGINIRAGRGTKINTVMITNLKNTVCPKRSVTVTAGSDIVLLRKRPRE